MKFVDEMKINCYVENVLEYIRNYDKLNEIYLDVMLDGELYAHHLNVTKVAIQLAIGFGLCDEQIFQIALGAILHDIGKIKTPYNILYKPARLNDDELVIMQKHPVVGYNLIKHLSIPDISKTIVLEHHEKTDGKGYPYGIAKIALEVQLVTVADIFSALTERRIYHSPKSVIETLNFINEWRNINQRAVDILVRSVSD